MYLGRHSSILSAAASSQPGDQIRFHTSFNLHYDKLKAEANKQIIVATSPVRLERFAREKTVTKDGQIAS